MISRNFQWHIEFFTIFLTYSCNIRYIETAMWLPYTVLGQQTSSIGVLQGLEWNSFTLSFNFCLLYRLPSVDWTNAWITWVRWFSCTFRELSKYIYCIAFSFLDYIECVGPFNLWSRSPIRQKLWIFNRQITWTHKLVNIIICLWG